MLVVREFVIGQCTLHAVTRKRPVILYVYNSTIHSYVHKRVYVLSFVGVCFNTAYMVTPVRFMIYTLCKYTFPGNIVHVPIHTQHQQKDTNRVCTIPPVHKCTLLCLLI